MRVFNIVVISILGFSLGLMYGCGDKDTSIDSNDALNTDVVEFKHETNLPFNDGTVEDTTRGSSIDIETIDTTNVEIDTTESVIIDEVADAPLDISDIVPIEETTDIIDAVVQEVPDVIDVQDSPNSEQLDVYDVQDDLTILPED